MKKTLFEMKNLAIAVLLAVVAFQYQSQKRLSAKPRFTRSVASSLNLGSTQINAKLASHTKLFSKKEVIRVNEQVFVGIGYGLANSIIIEGATSYIVVDTLESIEGATEFRKEFDRLFNDTSGKGSGKGGGEGKAVSHIIFTHYHADHTQGTTAFFDDEEDPPTIISHALTKTGLHRVNSVQSSIVYTRAMRQFGTLTKEYDRVREASANANGSATGTGSGSDGDVGIDGDMGIDGRGGDGCGDGGRLHINSGIGPELLVGDAWDKSILMPSMVLHEDYNRLEIDGVVLEIYYAPGETDDQIFVYLPQTRTLLPADNIYETFPNIYAIRGSPTRDASKWVQSLDTMRYMYKRDEAWMNDPANRDNIDQKKGYLGYVEYMVPSHTRPVIGSQKIYDLLTVYRDGIQYIHDQTLRFTNKGMTPSEMIPIIKNNMPARIKDHPWLIEFYGTYDWSIRGVFNSYLGWFSGDAADLFPLSKAHTAANMVQMFAQFDPKSGNNNHNGDGNSNGKHGHIVAFLLDMAEQKISLEHGDSQDCQWGLDVATNIMALRDDVTYHGDATGTGNAKGIVLSDDEYERSKSVRIRGLQCMAGYQISANGRNYYLTSALENSGNFKVHPSPEYIDKTVMTISLDFVFDSMMVRFKVDSIAEAYRNSTFCYIFDITGDKLEENSGHSHRGNGTAEGAKVEAWYLVELRDGVVEIIKGADWMERDTSKFGWLLARQECMDASVATVAMRSDIYREVVSGVRRNELSLYAQGEIRILKGSALTTRNFPTFFERE